jgi:hypothetical protein
MSRYVLGVAAGMLVGVWGTSPPAAAPAEPDWPQIHGPAGSWIPRPDPTPLIDDLNKAKLLWESEDKKLGVGKLRSFGNPYPIPSSGIASPIVADGKIFFGHFVPSGDVTGAPPTKIKGGSPLDALIAADDVMLAADVATGKTVWKAVMAGKGLNRPPSKRGGWGTTPAFHAGKVFHLGTTGRLYAFDAGTGKPAWEIPVGPAHEELEKIKKESLAAKAHPTKLPYGLVSLAVADGVLVAPADSDGGIAGFNPVDGKKLWDVPNATARFATPAVWTHGGREYVLCGNDEGVLRLIDPKSGKVLWSLDGFGPLTFTLAPSPTHVVLDVAPKAGKGGSARFGAVKLSPAAGEKSWSLPDDPKYLVGRGGDQAGYRRAIPHGGHQYILLWPTQKSGGNRLCVVRESDGAILSDTSLDLKGAWPMNFFLLQDRFLFVTDAGHCDPSYAFFSLDPKGVRKLCEPWTPPHKGCTGYEVPFSEPVLGGLLVLRTSEGTLRCYDLRKP